MDNSGNPVGAFRYVSHYPLFLGAGDYTIGGFYPRKEKSKDVDPIAIAFRNVATAPGVTFEGGRSTFGLRFPIGDQLSGFPEGNSYFGPNSQFRPSEHRAGWQKAARSSLRSVNLPSAR